MFLMGLFVILWTLPFMLAAIVLAALMPYAAVLWGVAMIIPGIVVSFRYVQAFYILAENPSKGALQCITESKWLMVGNKGKYFKLMLTLTGWYILANLPQGIYQFVISGGDMATYILSPIERIISTILLTVPYVVFVPYMSQITMAFYDILTGRLKPHYIQAESVEINNVNPQENRSAPSLVVTHEDLFVEQDNNQVFVEPIETNTTLNEPKENRDESI